MIAFSCPKYGKQLKPKADFAGRKTTCPGWQGRFTVPAPVQYWKLWDAKMKAN